MSLAAYDMQSPQPALIVVPVRILGTGASAPTKEYGDSITVTRLGVGNYRLTWSELPGTFIGFPEPGKQATATGALKGCTCDAIGFDSTNKRLDIQLWNSAGAARELAAAEWLTMVIHFKRTGV